MINLATLSENVSDLSDVVSAHRQLSIAERDGLLEVITAFREGLDALEERVKKVFAERDAAFLELTGRPSSPVATAA